MAFMFATVAIAVAFCTAAFGFSEQLSVQLSGDAGALTLPVGTISVTAGADGATTATAIDDSVTETVRSTDGVLEAFGVLDQPVSFRVSSREQPDRPVQLRGLVLSSAWDPNRWQVVEGREPVGPDEVAVDVGGAIVGLAPLGSRTRLQLPTGTRSVDVVGLVEPAVTSPELDGADSAGALTPEQIAISSAHVVLPADEAASMLGAVGKVDRVSVVPEPGADADAVADRLRSTLPDGLEVVVVTDRTQATQQTVASIDEGVRSGTSAFAALTVLIAAFAVANVQTVVLAQRIRELALLRLVGAGRSQLARLVLVEAAIVGAAASVVGLGIGTVLAWVAVTVVDPLGVSAALLLTSPMVVAAAVVGLAVTLIGSAWPVVRASRAAPLDALSDTGAGAERTPVGPLVPAIRLVSVALTPLLGVSGRLGIGNAARRPARSAAAGATLMVTLALVAVVGTIGAGARETVQSRFETAGSADLYLERRGLVRVDPTSLVNVLAGNVGGLSAAAEVIAVDGVIVGPGGTERRVTTSGLARLASIMDLDITSGDPVAGQPPDAELTGEGAPDGVMLSDGTAESLGVTVGDTVTLQSTSGGEIEVRVVATYANTAFVGPAVVARAAVEQVNAEGTFELAALEVADDAPTWAVRRQLRRVGDSFPKVRVHTPESFAELNSEVTDTVLRVIGVLLVGSVGIGMLGLGSTQALAILERRRELVMLRAVGASRGQIRALVGVEAGVIAGIASVIGLGAGALVGWWGARFVPEDLLEAPIVPWMSLAWVGLAATAIAVLVSLAVARRATRVAPADAGRSD